MERPPVDLGQIDAPRGSRQRRDRLVRIGRHAEIAREQVHGPERQHAEHLVARRERRNRRARAAVAAADDHGVVRSERGLRDLAAQLLRLEQANIEALAARLQRRLDFLDDARGAGVEQRAGARIEQNEDAFHEDAGRGRGQAAQQCAGRGPVSL